MPISLPTFSIIPSNVKIEPLPAASTSTANAKNDEANSCQSNHSTATGSVATRSKPALNILGESDRDIFNYIFDPNIDTRNLGTYFSTDSNKVAQNNKPLKEIYNDIDDSILTQVFAIEREVIQLTSKDEGDSIQLALEKMTEAIKLAPTYAPSYNNRAQVYQLLHRPEEAMEDCNLSIGYLKADDNLTYQQVYTQRGFLHERRSADDEARADFEVASRRGSAIAKKELVRINPYAAMCNAMLSRAMKEFAQTKGTDANQPKNDAA